MNATRTLTVFAILALLAGCHLSYTSDRGWHDPTETHPNGLQSTDGQGQQPNAVAPSLSSRVATFRVTIDKNLQKVFDRQAVHVAWKNKFKNHSGFTIVKQKDVDKAQKHENDGKYIYFELGDATRVHLHIGTVTKLKSARGKLAKVTQLVLTARVGKRGELRTFKLDGRNVGFDGKVWPDSTFQKKLIEKELEQMFANVCGHIGG